MRCINNMTTEELKNALRSSKYGFPYFRTLVDKREFFNSPVRLDLDKRSSDTIIFNSDIADVFEIVDDSFKECYDAVVNGEGDENRKIHSLRSSSLLGLLAFYKVHSGTCMKFEKVINGKSIMFSLSEVVFEKTNRVFHPSLGLSSIDVALYGTANGDPCVLYLESKLTEYLDRKDMKEKEKDKVVSYPIRGKYSPYYKRIMEGFPGLGITADEKKGVTLFSNDGESHYCEGIKQMISHYIGAMNSEDLFKGMKVFLGTILYDFSQYKCGVDDDGHIIGDYQKLYSALAKRLNSLSKDRLQVIEDAFTYQDFFKQVQGYELDKYVKEYYQL